MLFFLNNCDIQSKVKQCKQHMTIFLSKSDISDPQHVQHIIKWFQDLCRLLAELITHITNHLQIHKDIVTKTVKEQIFLYLNQIISSLSLIIDVIIAEKNSHVIVHEYRRFATKKLYFCLDSLSNSSFNNDGNFVNVMNTAIETISKINVDCDKPAVEKIYEQAQFIFEEVLCHAMSVAHLAFESDYKMIKGSCHMVLETLNSLKAQLQVEKINKAMCYLLVDLCKDKLYVLENRVNTAVLRLCLSVFSEYMKPLDNLYEFYGTKENDSEFKNLITQFDSHVDSIIQIGLFAVACSDDMKNCIKIRNCLANLEYLECELVPSLELLKFENSDGNKLFVNILRDYWSKQANLLCYLIYLIIEPIAFIQIISEKLKDSVDDMDKFIKNGNNLNQDIILSFLQKAQVLIDFLKVASKDMSNLELNDVMLLYKDIRNVHNEINNASLFLFEKEINHKIINTRILKRCQVLVTVVKRIYYKLFYQEKNASNNNPQNEEECQFNNIFFDHILTRGKQLLQERSILYKTPQRTKATCNIANAISEKTNIYHVSIFKNNMECQSCDLQTTDILNGITDEIINFPNSFQQQIE